MLSRRLRWSRFCSIVVLLCLLLPTQIRAFTFTTTLGPGDRGVAVAALQTLLRQVGLYTYPEITSYYGPVTQAAVALFQRTNGIVTFGTPATTGYGLVGPKTRQALNAVNQNALVQTGNVFENSTTSVQQFLIGLGYLPYQKPTGMFDLLTSAALRAFQKGSGLPVTGVADTRSVLTLELRYLQKTLAKLLAQLPAVQSGGAASTTSTGFVVRGGGSSGGSSYSGSGSSGGGSSGGTSGGSATTTATSTAPVITNLNSIVGSTTVTVSWTTDQTATSKIVYGTATGVYTLGSSSSALTTSHTIRLSGLTSATTYYYRVSATNGSALTATSSETTFTTASSSDVTPPILFVIYTGLPQPTSATISWFTNEPATSKVVYGPTTSYGSTVTTGTALTTYHVVTLSGLTSESMYHYAVVSKDAAGNTATSSDDLVVPSGTLPYDANGFTVFTPVTGTGSCTDQSYTGTCIFYVSSSTGSDLNDGLSTATPVQTLTKGMSLLRNHHPDWLLLKKGDSWTETLGRPPVSGVSADEPIRIGSYGTGARPVIKTNSAALLTLSSSGGPTAGDYLAITGLNIYDDQRDPSSPTFSLAAATSTGPTAIEYLNANHWELLEDNKISFFSNNITIEAPVSQNFYVRKNVIVDAYDARGAHAQGLFASQVNHLVVEDNLFDHNGSNDSVVGAQPTIFNHNLYLQGAVSGTSTLAGVPVITGNVFANDSSGNVLRSGGILTNNLFLHSPYAFGIGAPTPTTTVIQNNVVQDATDLLTTSYGWGMYTISPYHGQDMNQGTVTFANNIIDHTGVRTTNNGRGIEISASTTNDAHITNNIICDWQNPIKNGAPATTVLSGNVTNDPTCVGLGYLDPLRSITSYDADVLGGAGTLTDYLNASRNQSQDTWNSMLTASSVNAYIRAGFVSDTVPPTVTVTAPTAGATLTGQTIFSASTTDNGRIASVTYRLDGTSIGTATTSPFSLSTTTTNVPDGQHTLTAVAEDAAGNYATSSGVTVTLDNTAPVIASVSASSSSTTATIVWTTDKVATSNVRFGTASGVYTGASSTSALVTSHRIVLSGLANDTTYYYVVVSSDTSGKTATSSEHAFLTSSLSLDPSTNSWVAAVISAGGTVSTAQQTRVNNLVMCLKTNGLWTLADRDWLFVAENETQAKIDLIHDATFTKVGTMSYGTSTGYTGIATTSPNYLNTGFVPATAAGNFATTSASFGIYDLSNSTSTHRLDFGTYPHTNSYLITLYAPYASTQVQFSLNGLTSSYPSIGTTTSRGYSIISATSSTAAGYYRNGALLKLVTGTLSGLSPYALTIGGGYLGGPALNSDHHLGNAFIAGGMTSTQVAAWSSCHNTYMAGLGLSVY